MFKGLLRAIFCPLRAAGFHCKTRTKSLDPHIRRRLRPPQVENLHAPFGVDAEDDVNGVIASTRRTAQSNAPSTFSVWSASQVS